MSFRKFFASVVVLGLLPLTLSAAMPLTQLGDLDGDGVFTANDLAKLVGHSSGTAPLPEAAQPFADLNGDSVINDADHTELISLILGSAEPRSLPLATVKSTSPYRGEGDVAVTRETVVHFTMPLALNAALDTAQFHAKFGDRKILSRVEISSDRRKASLFYLEPLPSNARLQVVLAPAALKDLIGRPVDLDGDGVAGGAYSFAFDTLSISGVAGTAIKGRVLASEPGAGGADVPLAGVTVTVDGAEETLRTTTDAEGNFILTPCPAGSFFVHVDGRTHPGSDYPNGSYFPSVGKRWEAVARNMENLSGNGQDTARGVVYLPLIVAGTLQPVSQTEDTQIEFPEDVVDRFPQLEGTQLIVPPNSLFADDGTRGGKIGIAPVDPDRLPSPLPAGLELPMVITIQSDGGTNFDTPVPMSFPNLPDPNTGLVLPAGAKSALMSFNHDLGEWEVVGPMTVTEDGKFVKTDAGVGVRQPGWHGSNPGSGGGGPRGYPQYPGGPKVANDPPPATPPLPPCGPDFQVPRNLDEAKRWKAWVAAHNALTGGTEAVKLLEKATPTRSVTGIIKGLFNRGKGAADAGKEIEKLVLTGQGYEAYLDACIDVYIEFADAKRWQLPPLPCNPAASATAHSRKSVPGPAPAQSPLRTGAGDVAGELTQARNQLLSALKEQIEIEKQLEIFYAGKPENYQPTPAEKVQLDAIQAQLNSHLGGLDPVDFYRPMWATLMERTAEVADAVLVPTRESAFYSVRRKADPAPFMRGRTSLQGNLPGLILAADTEYEMRIFYPSTSAVGEVQFRSGVPGSQTDIPIVGIASTNDVNLDTDGDGLVDAAEAIIGTAKNKADTDDDAIPDGAEVRQGTDPVSGFITQTGVIASVPTSGPATDVSTANNMALTANGVAGISVFNIANGVALSRITDLDTPGNAVAVSAVGRYGAVADTTSLLVVDLGDPGNIRFSQRVLLEGVAAVVVSGPVAYAGSAAGVITAVDMASGSVLGELTLPDAAKIHDLAVWKDALYALQPGKLTAINTLTLSPEGTLPVTAVSPASTRRARLFAGEGTLYASHSEGFSIIDTTADPLVPSLAINYTNTQRGWKQIVANGSGMGLAAVSANLSDDGDHDVDLYSLGTSGRAPVFGASYPTPGLAAAVSLFNGLAYVADTEEGLLAVSYLPFDRMGQPPAITIDSNFALNHGELSGQIEEGKLARVSAAVTDDVQVRNVEYYIDENLALVDGNYPFEYRFVAPARSATNTAFTLRAKATDTGGNVTWSPLYTITLAQDIFAPVVQRVSPRSTAGALKTVLALFNEPLDPATVTAAHFRLTHAGPDGVLGNADDTAVSPALVSYREDLQAASFAIEDALPGGAYRGLLSTGIQDVAGNALAADYTWDFTVDNSKVHWLPTNNGTFHWGDAANWSTGTVPGTGSIVVIDAGPGVRVEIDGQDLQGVSVTVLGGASLVLGNGQTATLSNVTLNSDLRMEGNSSLIINSGLTLNNAKLILMAEGGIINPTSQSLTFEDAQTISGTGEIILGNGGTVYLTAAGTTLEAGITLRARGAVHLSGGADDPVTNKGTIITDTPATVLYLTCLANQGTLQVSQGTAHFKERCVNSGTLEVGGTGVLAIGGDSVPMTLTDLGTISRTGGEVAVTGIINLGGATLALNAGTGTWIMKNGTLQNGSLATTGGAELQIAHTPGGHSILDSIDIQGNVSVTDTTIFSAPILEGSWKNHGSISLTDATLILGGTFRLADAGTITRSNSAVVIMGVIDNTGLTLLPNDLPEAFTLDQGCTVKGGTISAAGADAILMADGAHWKFDGVTLNRDLKAGSGCTLEIVHGLTLNNADIIGESVASPGNTGLVMLFQGIQTLGGTGQILFDDAALTSSSLMMDVVDLHQSDGSVENGHLTISAGITVKGGLSTTVRSAHTGSVTNQGSFVFAVADGWATIEGAFTQAGTLSVSAGTVIIAGGPEVGWTNTGTLNVSGTGQLHLGDTFTLAAVGTLNRTGGTVRIIGLLELGPAGVLALNAATGSWELGSASAGIRGGTVTTADGAVLAVPDANRAFLENVNLQGAVVVTAAELLLLGDWVNGGSITATDSIISLGGEFQRGEVGTINNTGSTVLIQGILDNNGSTFHLDDPTLALGTGGTIKGGVVAMLGAPPYHVPATLSCTFEAVALACHLEVDSPWMTFKNGLTLNGATVTLNSGVLAFEGTQTLGGTGEVVMAGAGTILQIARSQQTPQPAIVTVAATATITGHEDCSIQIGDGVEDKLINQGTIRADTAGKKIDIYGLFLNQGQLQQLNGGVIVIH